MPTPLKPGRRSVATDQLHESPDNPRRITEEALDALTRAMEADPEHLEARPLIVTTEGEIIAGNMRHRAAARAGWPKVPAYVLPADTPPERLRAIMLRDNNGFGTWEVDELRELLEQAAHDVDLDTLGFTAAELDDLLNVEPAAAPREAVDDDHPELPAEPVTQVGDLILLGEHRLLCGDSTQLEDVRRLLDGQRADAVITDPPYAIYGSSTGLSESITDDKIVRPFFKAALRSAEEATRQFAHVYVFCDWRSWPSWWEVARGLHLAPKNCLVWDKGSSGMGNNWANTHELIGFFVNMPEQKVMSGHRKTGMRPVLSPNIIRANRVAGAERRHNAAKPVDLLAHLLEHATEPGELVVDLFGGSGSTLIACEDNDRRCALMELDPGWCDVIVQRWEEFTGQQAVRPDRELAVDTAPES